MTTGWVDIMLVKYVAHGLERRKWNRHAFNLDGDMKKSLCGKMGWPGPGTVVEPALPPNAGRFCWNCRAAELSAKRRLAEACKGR